MVDASAIVKYVLREDGWEKVSWYVRTRRPLASVDHLLKEVGNAIWKHARVRRVISVDLAVELYERFIRLVETGVIVLEPETAYLLDALRIALEHGVTLYDALYIAQARRKGELLTSDVRQAEAALAMNVRVHLIE